MEQVGSLTRPAVADLVPVLPALQPLVPEGGLRPGSVVRVDAAPLGLALVAGACQGGGWCAAVGMPDFGVLSAVGMGADPDRLLLVDDPGPRWADVVATLAEAVSLVLVRPPHPATPTLSRRLTALSRKHGCVLAVAGHWEGAQLRLGIERAEWLGLGSGHGHLRARRAQVTATGRGVAATARSTWLWLPSPTGSVAPADPLSHPRRLEVVA